MIGISLEGKGELLQRVHNRTLTDLRIVLIVNVISYFSRYLIHDLRVLELGNLTTYADYSLFMD